MSDLEEKFVADDGVSSVPDAVTPEGGEIKKKKADVKKAVNPNAEKVDPAKVPDQKIAESEEADLDEDWSMGVSSTNAHTHAKTAAQYRKKANLAHDNAKLHGEGSPEHSKHMANYHSAQAKAIKSSYHAGDYGSSSEAKKDHKAHMVKAKEYRTMKEEAEQLDEIISIEESIAGMFEGMDLSEDFKSKVSLVFEAAVNEATKTRVDEAVATLEEEFEAKLEESVNSSVDEIVDNLDSYLDYVVGEWMEENEVAIESGIKVEMAESLMDGLKDLFHGHNVEINEETIDVVADLEEKVATLEEKANDTINENISLANEISALKAEKVFEEVSEGLTVSQKERFKTLSEKLDNENLDEYKVDLNTLKESFFKTKKIHAISEEVEEDEIITEEVETTKTTASPYSTVNAYAAALSKNSK